VLKLIFKTESAEIYVCFKKNLFIIQSIARNSKEPEFKRINRFFYNSFQKIAKFLIRLIIIIIIFDNLVFVLYFTVIGGNF
jgi:hypothetical protein